MSNRSQTPVLETVSGQFQTFARQCRESSPLYARLATGIADDREILTLAARAQKGERAANLLLAAVQFLLLKGTRHPLAAFYENPSATLEDPYPHFRTFCLEYAGEITAILATHRVQTNEVRRSALLLPAFVLVSRQARGRPLYLLEIGAAAGLNLLWDRYGYDYGNGLRSGEPRSPVQIGCVLRGTLTPPVPATLPEVSRRLGVDLDPVDVSDPEETLWLRSLIWPGNEERARLLENAITVAREETPEIIAGDGAVLLPELLADVPGDAALCVVRVFTNLSPVAREQFAESIARHGSRRDLSVISTRRGARDDQAALALVSYKNGARHETHLANGENHGVWLEWLVDTPQPDSSAGPAIGGPD